MAGYGIGIFELEGIVERVRLDRVISLLLGGETLIILHDSLIQSILLLPGQRCRLRIQSIETDLRLNLQIIVVRETKSRIREMQAEPFLIMSDSDKFCNVAIGNVVELFGPLSEMIAVLDHHKPVPPHEPLLLVLDRSPYAGIVPVGPLVGPAEDDGLIFPVAVERLRQCLQEFPSADSLHISEPIGRKLQRIGREKTASGCIVLGNHGTQHCSIVQYPRPGPLPDNGGQFREADSPETAHVVFGKSRAVFVSDRRKLGCIAYHQQPATGPVTHKRNKVIQQVSAAECRRRLPLTSIQADERDLIHHKKGILGLVREKIELSEAVVPHGTLPVDMLVYGIGRLSGIL